MTSSLSANQPSLWDEFDQLSRTITAALADTLRPYEISVADWGVLKIIAAGDDSGLRVRAIRDATRTESSRLAHQLRRLQDRELIERSRSAIDARGTVVRLTPAGHTLYAQVQPLVDQTLDGLLYQLDESSAHLLAGLLARINRSRTPQTDESGSINLRSPASPVPNGISGPVVADAHASQSLSRRN